MNPQNLSCRNEDDLFTLDPLDEIEPDRIININGDCYDLKPLYNWIYNLENRSNPSTGTEFSPEMLSLNQFVGLLPSMEIVPLQLP
jgi:hypothetical protein